MQRQQVHTSPTQVVTVAVLATTTTFSIQMGYCAGFVNFRTVKLPGGRQLAQGVKLQSQPRLQFLLPLQLSFPEILQ